MSDTPTPETTLSSADLVERFVKLREYRTLLKSSFDAQDKLAKAGMETVQAILLKNMNTDEMESLKTSDGTAYIHRTEHVRVKDWDAVYKYIMESGRLDLLGRRVNASAAKEFRDDTGDLPPGVTTETIREVRIRKT